MGIRTRRLARRLRSAAAVGWVLAWLLVVEVGLRIARLPRLAGALGVVVASEEPAPTTGRTVLRPSEARRLRALATVAPHWPFGSGACLRQSLVAGYILRAHEPRLRLGVDAGGGELHAHAWLEVDGLGVVGDQADFLPLVRR
jgi:hypothetical protein